MADNFHDFTKNYDHIGGVLSKIDILKHELVPPHIILSEEEKEEVMKKYKVKNLKQFPRILSSDPVVKALGGKPGDLIKIIRKSKTAGETIYYRVVVEG